MLDIALIGVTLYLMRYRKKDAMRLTVSLPSEKQCSRCNIVKSTIFFGASKNRFDGFRRECNQCRTQYRRSIGQKEKRVLLSDAVDKKCNACGETKTLSSYYVNNAISDKRSLICMECSKRRKKQKTIFSGGRLSNQHNANEQFRSCTNCGRNKQTADYPTARQCSDGRASQCKDCKKEKAAMKNLLHPEPTEHQEAVGFITWFKNRFPHVLIYHIPNGMKRDVRTARILKSEGVKPGMPDYHIPEWNIWIELKRKTKGSLSVEQKSVIAHLESIGHHVIVGYGATDASDKLLSLLNMSGAATKGG